MSVGRESKRYVEWRDAFFRRADANEALAFFLGKSGGTFPEREDVPLAAIHKARLQVTSFTEDEKAVSRAWLKEHGYSEALGGVSP